MHQQLVAAGGRIIGLQGETARGIGGRSCVAVPRPAPAFFAVQPRQGRAVRVGESFHHLVGGERGRRIVVRQPRRVIIPTVRVKCIIVRRARGHDVLQCRAAALVDHLAAAAGVAHAVGGALGRQGRGAAGFVHNHHVVGRVLSPREIDQGLAVHGRRCRRRIGQNCHIGRAWRRRLVVQERAAPVVRIYRRVICRPRAQAGDRHAAGLARRRHHHEIARANLVAVPKHRVGRVAIPISRI